MRCNGDRIRSLVPVLSVDQHRENAIKNVRPISSSNNHSRRTQNEADHDMAICFHFTLDLQPLQSARAEHSTDRYDPL